MKATKLNLKNEIINETVLYKHCFDLLPKKLVHLFVKLKY